MLPKKHRITKKEDFYLILKKGERIKGEFFDLIVKPTNHPFRFGIIVSNKIAKKATVRNMIKRAVRELAREKLKKLKGDYVVVMKKPVDKDIIQDVVKDTKRVFKKLKQKG